MKVCSKCVEVKPLSEFDKDKKTKDGLSYRCKSCKKAYREANKEKIKSYSKTYNKAYREANKEKIKAYQEVNKEKIKAYREANKERTKSYNKAYYEANKEKRKTYYEANKEKERARRKAYYEANREKINNRKKKRKKTDYLFKLRESIRSLIRKSINRKGYTKKSRTYELLGCTYEEFKKHIERQFTKGMNWGNYGKWHLDHIYPVSKAKNEEELLRLNHYTNFQPLWAEENISKGNKIQEGKQIKLL